MIDIHLSNEDADSLVRCLEWMLSETRMELADTDRQDFRTGLRKDTDLFERLIAQIRERGHAEVGIR